MMRKTAIFGTGGFGREVLECVLDCGTPPQNVVFVVDDAYYKEEQVLGFKVLRLSELSVDYKVVLAVGDPAARRGVVDRMPDWVEYKTIIHPSARVSRWARIDTGGIIMGGCVVTVGVVILPHVHLNLNTTVGHGVLIESFVTVSPGVNISGEVWIGELSYIGTNAAIREGINVCNKTTVGMGAVVVADISEPGVYVGNPARLK